jgi:hypothetical protein
MGCDDIKHIITAYSHFALLLLWVVGCLDDLNPITKTVFFSSSSQVGCDPDDPALKQLLDSFMGQTSRT